MLDYGTPQVVSLKNKIKKYTICTLGLKVPGTEKVPERKGTFYVVKNKDRFCLNASKKIKSVYNSKCRVR